LQVSSHKVSFTNLFGTTGGGHLLPSPHIRNHLSKTEQLAGKQLLQAVDTAFPSTEVNFLDAELPYPSRVCEEAA
jgi:hypothetical protein